MGGNRPEVLSVSNKTLNESPGNAQLLGTIPNDACEGQWTVTKETSGDTIYVGVKGKRPTSSNFDVKLTDSRASFSEDGVVPGDISAVGSVATSVISIYASYRLKSSP